MATSPIDAVKQIAFFYRAGPDRIAVRTRTGKTYSVVCFHPNQIHGLDLIPERELDRRQARLVGLAGYDPERDRWSAWERLSHQAWPASE